MKTCPDCAEEIKDEARKCKHCGSFLSESIKDELLHGSEPILTRFQKWRVVGFIATLIVIFILYQAGLLF